MFRLKLALTAVTFFVIYACDEVSSATDSRYGEDRYRERGGRGISGQYPSKMAPPARARATDMIDDGDVMRFLTPKPKIQVKKKKSTKIMKNPGPSHTHNRKKRGFYPYNPSYQPQWSNFEGLNTWKTSFYPIQRPYYVPVYGYDGRIPLYCPPCTCYHNPGTPQHNPNKPPFVAPTYLPPVTTTAPSDKNGTTMMPIDNRFGNNDDDDRPIWDNNGSYYPGRGTTPRSSVVPTRVPASRTTTAPPLVHKESDAPRPSTSQGNIAPVPTNILRPEGPSKCVWAIVSCCSTSSKDVSYECFDQLGCAGPFWDVNPCDTEYAKAAIETALNYYNSRL